MNMHIWVVEEDLIELSVNLDLVRDEARIEEFPGLINLDEFGSMGSVIRKQLKCRSLASNDEQMTCECSVVDECMFEACLKHNLIKYISDLGLCRGNSCQEIHSKLKREVHSLFNSICIDAGYRIEEFEIEFAEEL